MAGTVDLRAVKGAVAVRWVREDQHLAVIAERDQAEGLLTAAERRIAELERDCARLRFLLDAAREPLHF